MIAGLVERAKQRRGVRQFAKFAIVGATSTVIDWGLHALLYKWVDGALVEWLRDAQKAWLPALTHPDFDAAFTVLKVFSFVVATLNGFYWNRRWTFRIQGKEDRHKQIVKFYVISGIGLAINTLVASQIHRPGGGPVNYALSLGIATFVTMFWNFGGHKFWTFHRKR